MNSRSWMQRALVGATLTVAVGLVGALPAAASESDPVGDILEAVVDAAGAVAVPVTESGGDLVATTAAGTVEIPQDPTEGVTIDGGAGAVTIGLPGAGAADDAQTSGANAVYTDAAPDTDLVARPTPDGAQVLITINGDDAPGSYDFPVTVPDGAALELQDDGSVAIVRHEEGVTTTIGTVERGTVERPWAKDANGAPVPTHFTIDGTNLTQHVDHHGAAYPVVADPKYTWGWISGTIRFNRAETTNIAGGGISILTGMVSVPGPWTAAFWAYAGPIIWQAAYGNLTGRCLQLKVGGTWSWHAPVSFGVSPSTYTGGYCR